MVNKYEGNLKAEGKKFGIVISRFNDFLTSNLLEGALDALRRHGAEDKKISVAWVPGAFEIPYAAKKLINTNNFDAIICLGAVIRGATPHFELIANELSKGIANLSMETGVPVIFGIITADTLEQALERAGTKAGNKGFDAAVNAIEMANLFSTIK
ncbi:6,7-dimethyl-8-ribityllumazine synthase [Candidatus Desantisbacteria bacterium]|nr:6,7-dimethyl-8-ribityllumazine synthase [Candidatus Desantisbacteria bacterium]